MVRRIAVVPILAVVVVFLAVATVGFASSDGKLNPYGGGKAGSVLLVWSSPTSATASSTFVGCSVAISLSILVIQAKNLGPGANCVFTAVIHNTGTVSATLQDTIDLTEGFGCNAFQFQDNVHGLHAAPTVGAGGTFVYRATFGLSSSAGNSCQSKQALLKVTISGTACCEQRGQSYSCY